MSGLSEIERLRHDIATILDRYAESDNPEQCMPEDRWRLYRDLRECLRQSALRGES